MSSKISYCDYNASAPLRLSARAAMMAALDIGGNPSSVHKKGRAARAIIEQSRADIATGLAVSPEQIVFTSGGTESVVAALWGARSVDPSLQLWAADIEHECVLAQGVVRSLPVEETGYISLLQLREVLQATEAHGMRPLLSLTMANNETGVIQPIAEATALVHACGGLVHCDAAQAVGKIAVSPEAMKVDYMSFSAHKLGGPHGAGALYIRDGAPFRTRQGGGGQEEGRRSGTENLAGIAGFGAAFVEAIDDIDELARLADKRDALEQRLQQAVPGMIIYGKHADRLPNTSCFSLPGFPAETQLIGLDLRGVAVSAGSACSSGKLAPSRTLASMGASPAETAAAIRASFGWDSSTADFTRLAEAWLATITKARPGEISVASASRKTKTKYSETAI